MFHSLQSRETGFGNRAKLFEVAKGSRDFVQRLKLDYRVLAHTGCVNTLCWSSTGQNILSGSDDQHLVITNPFKRKILTSIRSGHRANIFSAKYLPFSGDRQIISCSGDGKIYYTKVGSDDQHEASLFDCHFGTTYEVIVVPNEASTFLSCGEDGTVRWFDLRIKSSCLKEDCKDDVLINCRRAVTALAVNPVVPYQLAIGCSDSSVRLFDRRMLGTRSSGHYTGRGLTGMISSFTAPNLASRSHRITSLSYSPDGGDMLVSYSSEYIYLFGTNEMKIKQLEKSFTKPEKIVEPSGVIKKVLPGFRSSTLSSSSLEKTAVGSSAFLQSVVSSSPQPTVSSAPSVMSVTEPSVLQESKSETPGPSKDHSAPNPEEEGYTQEQVMDPFPDDQPEVSRQPPFKRLRMRGDWSDTGPNARPEAERNAQGRNRPLMQRMSDMLTRWLDGNLRNNTGGEQNQSNQEPASGSHDAPVEEDSTEMEEVPSGWQDMPSATSTTLSSERSSMEVDSNVQEQPTISGIQSEHEQNDSTGESENTHVCDNSNSSKGSGCHGDNNTNDLPDPSGLSDGVNSPQSDRTQNETSEHSQSVQSEAISDSNRDSGQLEPVISLHYSTEGTTSSTIRLGFARFENLEAGILQRSAEDASLSDLVPESVGSQDQNNALESHSSHRLQDSVEHGDTQTQESLGENVVHSIPSEAHCSVSDPVEGTSAICDMTTVVKKDVDVTHSLTKGQSSSDSSSSCDEGQTLEFEFSESHTNPPVMDKSESQSSTECSSQPLVENNDIIDEPIVTGEPMEDEGQGSSKSHATHLSHLHIRPETSSAEADTPEVPPAPPRQRRIGRSGPSMGDISVGLEVENSDEEPSEEGGENREGGRDNLERHITAIRLQEMYRKRQEEKEKEEMELRNIFQPHTNVKYRGHRNARTMIKEANFWGEDYVMSGSDCGHIFIWDRATARLVMLLEGDRHVVNCLQPHPFDPVLASSGIDYDIKIWAPLDECTNFSEDVANEIMSRNEIMLEETRDTITVPAAFMLRVLASLNQIRAGRASVSTRNQEQASSDSD